jgi:hypothetical protein
MIGQKVGRAGLGIVLALGLAGGAMAAPFSLLREGEDRAWVVDGAGGAVAFCELEMKRGPKVIDVFGSEGQPRPDRERAAEPVCTDVLDAERGLGAGEFAVFAVPAFRQIVNHRFYGREVELRRGPDRIVTVVRPSAAGLFELDGQFRRY